MDRATLHNRIDAEPVPGRRAEHRERLRSLHRDYCAAHSDILSCISAVDTSGSFVDDGAPSVEAWVSSTLGVSYGEAKRWVQAARALAELPAVASSYSEGRLSWDKVKTVTRFATPDNEEVVARDAEEASLSQLQGAARRAKAASLEEVH